MCRSHGFEFLLVIGQLLLQQDKLVHELPKQLVAQRRELVLVGLKLADHGLSELCHPCGDHDDICVQEPMDPAIPAEPSSPVITVSAALAFRNHRCKNTP